MSEILKGTSKTAKPILLLAHIDVVEARRAESRFASDDIDFGRDDLPLVCKAMDRAHTWIYEQARPSTNGTDAVAPPDVDASELS